MGVMKRCTMALGVFAVAVVATPQAHAQAIITNGTVSLGVDLFGNLNVSCGSGAPGTATSSRCINGGNGVGVYSNATGDESTYDGCPCEGWGAGVAGGTSDGTWGGANASAYGFASGSGSGSVTSTSYTQDGLNATTVVNINNVMSVTQFFHPSATPGLYQVDVTITNLTGDVLGVGDNGIRYRREMDWDIEPTPFDEITTINGVGASGLLNSSDNGFIGSNPFDGGTLTNTCDPSSVNADVYHSGPCDHGAAFDFGFPALAAGASDTFSIFYGVATNEANALSELGAVGADNVYSLGQSNCNGQGYGAGPDLDSCVPNEETFIFGFKGIKGAVTLGTPEPASFALMGTGLLGLAGFARRRRASKEA